MKKQIKTYTLLLLLGLASNGLMAQTFQEVLGTPFTGVADDNQSMTFADVNGDTYPDVLITGFNGGLIANLYLNDGSGGFTLDAGTPFVPVYQSAIAFADYDNDGDQDVLITGSTTTSYSSPNYISYLYQNDGFGNFTLVFSTTFVGVHYGSVAFEDINGDSFKDIIITGQEYNLSAKKIRAYINTDCGSYRCFIHSLPPVANIEPTTGGSLDLADVNGDGSLDLLITGSNTSNAATTDLYINDGSGIFSLAANPFDAVFDGDAAIFDVDNDNDNDVIVTGSAITKMYYNDGSGGFTQGGGNFQGVLASAIEFADVDNDNYLDVMISGTLNGSSLRLTRLYINGKNGYFYSSGTASFEGVNQGSIAFADVNNDNKIDVLITGANNSNQSIAKLYMNTTCFNSSNSFSVDVCGSYTVPSGSNTYTTIGNYTVTDIIPNACGADSVLTIDVTVRPIATGTDTRTECNSYQWIDGNTYTASNNTATYTFVGGAANGCDSIVTLDLTINYTATGTDTRTECNSYQWIDGNTYTASNNTATYAIVGGAASGCDSIVTLDLTMNYTATGTDTRTECNSYQWIDGNTYTASNNTATYTIVGGAASGCDSIVTLDLTINYTATGTDTRTECNSYQWIDGNTYTSDNNTATYTFVGGAANGCDSIVTLDLTILNPSGIDVQTACNDYTWIDGNTYYVSNNTATYLLVGQGVNGCDSLVTLDLTILDKGLGTDTRTECSPFTWIDGLTYTSDNNFASFNIAGGAANGCDSIVFLDLTITTVDTSVTQTGTDLTANELVATYQWLDCNNNYAIIPGATFSTYYPTTNGSYAVAVTYYSCTDTSSCHNIVINGVEENNINNNIYIYPNPVQNQLTIKTDNLQIERVELLDVTGKVVKNITKNFTVIDVADLQNGIYFVKTYTDKGVGNQRIIKN